MPILYSEKMINQAIEELADDRVDSGIDCLKELAKVWKGAGMARGEFLDLCNHIEHEASELSESSFVQMKMKIAFKKEIIH